MPSDPISTTRPPSASPGRRPVVLLTFANDRHGDARGYLRNLVREQRQIERALDGARDHIRVVVRNNVCLDDLFDLFAEHNDDIVAFHYGGHANPEALLFEDDDGRPVAARIEGVAERLGQLPALSLIFLNGCTTAPHVGQIQRQCPVPIIATDVAIKDSVACDFAHRFYADLGQDRTIRDAYASAESRIKAAAEGPSDTCKAGAGSHRSGMAATLELPAVAPRATGAFHRLTGGLRMLRSAAARRNDWPWRLHAPKGHSARLHWRLSTLKPVETDRRAMIKAALLLLLLIVGGVFTAISLERPSVGSADVPTGAPPVDVDEAAPPLESAAEPAEHAEDDLAVTSPALAWLALADGLSGPHGASAAVERMSPDAPWPPAVLMTHPAPIVAAHIRRALRRAMFDRVLAAASGVDGSPGAEAVRDLGRLLWTAELLAAEGAADGAAMGRQALGHLRAVLPAAPPGGAAPSAFVRPQIDAGPVRFGLAPKEVTVGEMRRLLPDLAPGVEADRPALVDWYTAAAYAAWIGARLPSDAEWIAAAEPLKAGGACRSGPHGALAAVARFAGPEGPRAPGPVGGLASCNGLFDLLGNADEWLAADAGIVGLAARARGGSAATVHDDAGLPVSIGPPDALRGFRLALDLPPAPKPPAVEKPAAVPRAAISHRRTHRGRKKSPPTSAALEARIRRALDPDRCQCADARRTIGELERVSPVRARRLERQYKETCRWLTGPCTGR